MIQKNNVHVSYTKEEVLRFRLSSTGISDRMIIDLSKKNIFTVGDLTKITKKEFLSKPGFGDALFLSCLKVLRLFNLNFKV